MASARKMFLDLQGVAKHRKPKTKYPLNYKEPPNLSSWLRVPKTYVYKAS